MARNPLNVCSIRVIILLSNRVQGVASRTDNRREVVSMMTTFEALSLMIAFAMLIVTLLAYIDRNNKRK